MIFHKTLGIFIFLILLIFLSACRIKVNDDSTPSLIDFTINGEKGRPYLINLNNNNHQPLIINLEATSQNSIRAIFIIAAAIGSTEKELGSCNGSPTCEVKWFITVADKGSYEIKARVIDDKGNIAIFQYDGDDTNFSDVGEVDVGIGLPN